MVKYNIHENGWTVILEDFDFSTATQDDINHIARLIASNTLVVARNQQLTIKDEVRVAEMFKNPQRFYHDDETSPDYNFKGCEIPGADRLFLRVTAELNEDGLPGIAGHASEMHWHSNDQTTPDRRPIVWLYSVKGSRGSRTSWNNNIMSYEELDEDKKRLLDPLKLTVLKNVSLREDEEDGSARIDDYCPSLVMENIAGKKGMYFPFLQISGFEGLPEEQSREIMDWLAPYTIQEKFCYHHDWEDGDVILTEQWLGIHKRWEFEEIEGRLLHRGAWDFPEQDYKN
jgi:alpha-ketoglutarate-dependent taurine dioxygenase